jgi:Fe-S-cluster-containing dehydrogenase component
MTAASTATTTRPPAFVHDLETCVGCHACVIACANENALHDGRLWRQIVSYNPARHPAQPTFHLSIACNHCLDAPCLRHCPALAIARDPRTGAVLIDDARCIGCRYCGWVCPFDAPRFDPSRGVMTKCTLCSGRLAAGRQPACTSLCPTGALSLDGHVPSDGVALAAFPRTDARPMITFLPVRHHALADHGPGGAALGVTSGETSPALPRKVTLRTEWSLAVFTFVAIVLVAWVLAWALGASRPRLLAVAGLGMAGMAVSAAHLGRPTRAWRAMLNWRDSWLSREVITYGGFLAVAVATLAWDGPAWARWLAAAAGFGCLVCVDQVYAVMARDDAAPPDRATAVVSGIFLGGILAHAPAVFVPAGLARLIGFLARTRAQPSRRTRDLWWLAVARVAAGAASVLLALAFGAAAWPATVLALLAEWLDRCDFYNRLDIVTPARTAQRALDDALRRLGTPRTLETDPSAAPGRG